MKTLEYPHDTSTPYRPQTNGIAERAGRRVKEGTTCVLVQSGLNYEWWREAQEFFCFTFCVTEVMLSGLTPYQDRFSKNFDGPIYPFGCEIQYKPYSPDGIDRTHKMGCKLLSGLFIGYAEKTGVS